MPKTIALVVAFTTALGAAHGSTLGAASSDRSVVTNHSARIGARRIDYVATAGTLLLPNTRHATAAVFYVAYVARGLGKMQQRPITFAYNGGPGSSSALFNVTAFGPRVVVSANIRDNQESILDKTDLVFIDAVGTGFSHLVNDGSAKDYYGIDQDATAFSQFIRRYLDANDRWKSPKYLLGTSYGTTRSAVLVKTLEGRGIAISGLILMSTVLDFTKVAGSDDDRYWLYVPTEAAIAAYYHRVARSRAQLTDLLDTARAFARGPYEQALLQGDGLSDRETARIAAQLHAFIGLPASEIVRLHLRVPPDRFRKALLGDRYDTAPKNVDAASDPSATVVLNTIAPAFKRYVREELRFRTQDDYAFISSAVNEQWDWSRGGSSPLGVDVSDDLRAAMTANPSLRILSVNGLYDLTTPFFATEYELRHLGLAPSLRDHISFRYYPSGHLTYLNPIAHAKLKIDLDAFYSDTQKYSSPNRRNASRGSRSKPI